MSASVQQLPGVISADLNYASGTLVVEYDPAVDPRAAVVRTVEGTGHGLESLDAASAEVQTHERSFIDRNRAEIATFGSGLFAGIGGLLGLLSAPAPTADVAYAIAVAFGGLLVWKRALVSAKARIVDMNILMSVAVFGAMALAEWGEAATVFFLFALGGLLESRSLERTRRSIRDLMDLTPPIARLVDGASSREVAVADVPVGALVRVRPGERIPLDGRVVTGASSVDEAPITGESVPVDKTADDAVFAGSLNVDGLIDVEVTATSTGSTLARIVYMVEEAQASRAPSQAFVDRFSRVYTPAVIWLAAAVAVVPPLVGMVLPMEGLGWAEWIRRGLVVLVVSCPCALVISTPVSIVSAIARATREGILVKGGAFLEQAAAVRALAFDKTGTLTTGRLTVTRVVGRHDIDEAGVLRIAAALESHSNHPVARAVVRAWDAEQVAVEAFEERHGRGVSGVVDGVRYELCSPGCARDTVGLSAADFDDVDVLEAEGNSVLALIDGERLLGLIGVADAVRDESHEVVEALHRLGIEHTVMLTGDNERVAESVAERTGLRGFLARLLPEAKTEAVHVLKSRYGAVAMVGDGVNDAPALAASDIGLAMGAAGTDTALETADVALMRDDLHALPAFFALGKNTVRIIKQNVIFSIGVKAVFLLAALGGYATLWMAVFADTGVSLLVILNGMRLLRPKATSV